MDLIFLKSASRKYQDRELVHSRRRNPSLARESSQPHKAYLVLFSPPDFIGALMRLRYVAAESFKSVAQPKNSSLQLPSNSSLNLSIPVHNRTSASCILRLVF
jgi:hypothetical protein